MNIRKRLYALVNPSRRKLLLFGCSCVREVWHLLKDECSKNAITATEAFAEGLIDQSAMTSISNLTWVVRDYALQGNDIWFADYAAAWAADAACAGQFIVHDIVVATNLVSDISNKELILAKQHQLFDDIFNEHS